MQEDSNAGNGGNCFNRYIVECKYQTAKISEPETKVLIDT